MLPLESKPHEKGFRISERDSQTTSPEATTKDAMISRDFIASSCVSSVIQGQLVSRIRQEAEVDDIQSPVEECLMRFELEHHDVI